MNKEQIYDNEIAPLMSQITAICEEHKIAMLASFAISTDDDPGLTCTTTCLADEYEPGQQQLDAIAVLMANQEATE